MKQRLQGSVVCIALAELRVGKIKERCGLVDKTTTVTPQGGSVSVIGREMFDKHVDWQVYADSVVLFESAGSLGKILGPFGKSGKFRLSMLDETKRLPSAGDRILLRFVKRSTLRPLGKAATARKSTASVTQTRALLQEDHRLLYPEASTPLTRELCSKMISRLRHLLLRQ
ncbi:hypothetical protein PINS_up006903 [Pythium insidiosum]|nr:hypothetical protein PINS_up006903 [Pythium insidiosum]